MQRKAKKAGRRAGHQVLIGVTSLAGFVAQALAQQAAPPAPATPQAVAPVVVTGYRAALDSSTKDKKEAIGFVDTVTSEDMGKFPDSNIAESLNRIPGVQVTREITGEGLNIQIRGLGTSFTKILLNGASVAVASTGRTDSQNTNREVDLDLLPTELFRKLTVAKSPTADMLEGGAAGVVDMRTSRAFDNPGQHVSASLAGVRNSIAGQWGDKGSVLASQTWGKEFGVLAGVAWSNLKVRTTGFETIGWTNANLSATQSTSATRNNTGGGNWTIPATVPAGAGNGLVTGATIDQAFLLANNPGLSITQIDNAIIPRLGRKMDESGTKDKIAGVISGEYRPSDSLYFYVDALAGKKKNDIKRIDINWIGRNGVMIPLNMKVDASDCSNGCVVTSGTFANSQFFLEYRPYVEDVNLYGVNPGMEWQLTKNLKLDAAANWTQSRFTREAPSVLVTSVLGNGTTVNLDNNGNDVPSITTGLNLNDPNNFGWNAGSRVNVQIEKRKTETKGGRANFTWGDKQMNLKFGAAYDDVSRRIQAFDNSQAWQSAVCGNNVNVYINGNNSAGCNGQNAPGSAASAYPGYGTGYTAGATTPLVFLGSVVPSTAVPSYLTPGPAGFVTVDWNKFANATNYRQFADSAPEVASSNTGANAGYVREKATGIYSELSGIFDLWNFSTRYNFGTRYVRTQQQVGSFVSLADPRNAAQNLQVGGRYPNINSNNLLDTTYSKMLPSGTMAINLTQDWILRLSGSRTMTRANPENMRPGIGFSSPSADVGTVGNPTLKPFFSTNADIGLEWYTGREGYVSATLFQKKLNGFTSNENITVPFTDLAAFNITYDTLTPTQQTAINARGGPNAATVVLTRQTNAPGTLEVQGVELNWVQPLDKFLPIRGFGYSANYTHIHQRANVAGFVALGVPPDTYNLVGYYEQYGYMARVSYTYSKGSQSSTPNQNGITNAALFGNEYKQVDFSSSIDLTRALDMDFWHMSPQITFDIINVTKESQRSYFQFPNAAFTSYQPSRTIVVGFRMKF